MPTAYCPRCKKVVPVKWDAKDGQWRYWPHGPENKRCPGSGVPVGRRIDGR